MPELRECPNFAKAIELLQQAKDHMRTEPDKTWLYINHAMQELRRPEPENKPRTNADRIRNMSNEELAVTLMCPNEMGMADIPCDHSDDKNCCQCLLDWLQQPKEEPNA